MDNLTLNIQVLIALFKLNTATVLKLLAILWGIQLLNWSLHYRLNILGIYPRSIPGLFGIFFATFLHGNFTHLLFNSIPFFVLANFILVGGWGLFMHVSLTIIIIGGLGVWLFGRKALHIGASILIMGYFSYLLINAYQHRTVLTLILAILTLYYFSGLALSLFPTDVKSSWEGHIAGFVGGIVAEYWYPLNF